ncbi:MAG: hypothetical protein H7Y59_17690 [Anaerolineales bacterium]|nr:hypothetical protein [Anaerolineales bacterium]
MRIAYVSLHWPRTLISGVGKKIVRQIGAWTAAGHEVQLFMHSIRRESDAPLIPGKVFYYPESGRLAGEWNRVIAARHLLDAVTLYCPDIIYLRYGMYVYPIHHLAKIAPLVEEITTNDLVQHEGLGLVHSLYNRLTRGIIIRHTSGVVYLSNELANSRFNSIFQKPKKVIGDGIDLNNIQPLPAPNNQNPQLVFIGSPGSLWQGVDKLYFLAKTSPDIGVHVIGYDLIEGINSLPDNMKLYGYLKTEEYKKVLAGMDCAIGSLALHRIQLNESSPLKTRECLALGLPMVLPYKDTDLNDLKCSFLLKIPNREDNVQTHVHAIRDFAYQMRGHRVERKQIINLDQASKELERVSFFKEMLDASK